MPQSKATDRIKIDAIKLLAGEFLEALAVQDVDFRSVDDVDHAHGSQLRDRAADRLLVAGSLTTSRSVSAFTLRACRFTRKAAIRSIAVF